MKLYNCSRCHNSLYFENSVCLNCGSPLGFDSSRLNLLTLELKDDHSYFDYTHPERVYGYCQNASLGTCNWLVRSTSHRSFCSACELNRIIPTLSSEKNRERWKRIEIAKHRLVYSLLKLNLPFSSKKSDPDQGLSFDFMADTSPENRVITGHDHGTITLNIEEADEAERVKHKLDLGERYRTLLGHFRHEIAHYYWERLIQNSTELQNFRIIFGDELVDYSKALQNYYEKGPKENWDKDFISPYATAHPWEDWAETWSHYFHLMDTLETAYSFGIAIQPAKMDSMQELRVQISKDPYLIGRFPEIIEMWLPLTFAINSLNRSMGYDDFYPFLISPHILRKLEYVHQICKTK